MAPNIKSWLEGHRAAGQRSLQLLREEGPADPAAAFTAAMELCDLIDLEIPDPVRERELEAARAAWAKVHAWASRQDPSR